MKFGGFSRPFRGLTVCGDSFVFEERDGTFLVSVIDGLGHGYDAWVAASTAADVIRASFGLSVDAIVRKCHQELRVTRGVAVGVLKVGTDGIGDFCGVGNIEVQAIIGASPSIFCLAGIVGHTLRTSKVMPVAMKPGDIYCLMSDGVSSRGNFKSCLPGDPESVARRIVEQWGRAHDDATAVVIGYGDTALLTDRAA